jgi:integrase
VAGQRLGVSAAGRYPADASHVRRTFRQVVVAAGLNSQEWTPRELRHSFVSLLSDADVPIERISRLVGRSSTVTTETIYRKQIRPVIEHGADVMDRIFPAGTDRECLVTQHSRRTRPARVTYLLSWSG